MQNLKLQFKVQKYLLMIILLFVATPIFAAQMSFDAKTTQVQVGEKFEVNLIVNTERESVNAFEGTVKFSKDTLDLKEIRDGNSIVNFWVEKPKNQDDAIIFSGITPGGFNGRSGLLFSAIFEAKDSGAAKFEIKNARVLRNDGTGSAANLTIMPLDMMISNEASAEIPALPKVKDNESPESFIPEIARDPSVFGEKWFLVFTAQDKGTGIVRYEIKETKQKFFTIFSKWSLASSPYVLKDQGLKSYIFVKAIDGTGNKRIAKLLPKNPSAWYKDYENWFIIVILIVIVYIAGKILWRRHVKVT